MGERKLKVMIVAGEASGDDHAAKLVRALIELRPDIDLQFFGSAGPNMRAAGVESTIRADDLSIVGLAEIAGALPMFLRAMKALKKAAADKKPDVAILVDFPEFNLKLARHLKKQGITVVYYISPQLWAWRQYRISAIKKYVDLLITILPFEKAWYARREVDHVEYVGSPLAMEVHPSESKEEFCMRHGLDQQRPVISFLPGSRSKEITRILPVMLDTVKEMSVARPQMQFVFALTNRKQMDGEVVPATIVEGETYNALNASDAAAIASGTATLEAGIIGTPMAIVYKTSALNYRIFEPMIDVPHYGLINLIAEQRVCMELIQDEFTSDTLRMELERLLEPDVNRNMRNALKTATDKLGHGGASKRAAEAVLRLLAQ